MTAITETKSTPSSSQIKSIGYDKENKIFEIVYKNNAKYHYSDVSEDLWEKAKEAESIGKFCAAYIKPRAYKLISR